MLIETYEQYQTMLSALERAEYVDYDIETTGSSVDSEIIGIALGVSVTEAYYLPLIVWDPEHEVTPSHKGCLVELYAVVEDILKPVYDVIKNKKLIMHNGIFDINLTLRRHKVDLTDALYADTILMKHLIDEERPFGLKEISVLWYSKLGLSYADANNQQKDLHDSVKRNGGKLTKACYELYKGDLKLIGAYAEQDVKLTRRLFLYCDKLLKSIKLDNFFYNVETMPLYRHFTIPAKIKGFPIDIAYFEAMRSELRQNIDKMSTSFHSLIKDEVKPLVKQILDKTVKVDTNRALKKLLKERSLTLADLSADEIFELQMDVWRAKGKSEQDLFNPASVPHMIWYLFELHQKPVISKSRLTQKPQVNADTLKAYKDLPAVNLLLKMRKETKLLTTYVEGILERQRGGVLYMDMLQFGTTSGRFSSSNPNCLSLDTEVLTAKGFKKYSEISVWDKFALYDPKQEHIFFEQPKKVWISEEKEHHLVSIKNQHFDIKVTDNHRCLTQNRKTGEYSVCAAADIPSDCRMLHGSFMRTTNVNNWTPDFIRLVVATQADATLRLDNKKRIRFTFDKQRKIDRLKRILNALQLPYNVHKRAGQINRYDITVVDEQSSVYNLLSGPEKTFPTSFILLSAELREVFLEEIFYWGGCSTRRNNYSSNNETNIDIVQALASLHGQRAHKRSYLSKKSKTANFQLDFTKRNYSLTTNMCKETKVEVCKVWCAEVSTGFFIVRRGSDTWITGNCQNLPRDDKRIKKGFVAPEGYKIVEADFSALEARCFAYMSGDFELKRVYLDGLDLYSKIGIDVWKVEGASARESDKNYLKKIKPEIRQAAKTIALAIPYGVGAGRLASIMKEPIERCQEIINEYLDTYPALRDYMQQQETDACNKGYVKTICGRFRHIPMARTYFETYGKKIFNRRKMKHQYGDKGVEAYAKMRNCMNNAKNFPIQGLAGHIVNAAMIDVAKAIKEANLDAYIALMVHDSILVIVKEEQAEQAAQILKHGMENNWVAKLLDVPMIAVPEIMNRYGEH